MKKIRVAAWVVAAVMAVSTGFPAAAGAQDKGFDFRKGFSGVAAKATPAVVFIQVEKQVPMGNMPEAFASPFDFFESPNNQLRQMPNRRQPSRGRQQMFRQTGQGSGFLISKDGYILTNTHVVDAADKIKVRLADGREFQAKRVGADAKTEVALIKIEGANLPALAIGDSDKLQTGEWVIAIGNPFGLKETLTVGVVSAKGRSHIGIADYEDFIQTDAAINPGNSGGPLLNIDAEVVGINTAIFSRSGGYMGIGFAVPIDMAMNIKEQLVTNGKVTRGYIGVVLNPGEVNEEMAKSFGRAEAGGVLIADVQKEGPAAKAGILSGDILFELDGRKIKDNTTFRNEVARILPNKKIDLTLFRDGKVKKVAVTVGAFPDDGEAGAGVADGAALLDKLGFDIQALSDEIAQQLGVGSVKGVVITQVDPGSLAQEAGLSAGMVILEVNRSEVTSVTDFEKAVGKIKNGNLLLRVKAKEGTVFVNLQLTD